MLEVKEIERAGRCRSADASRYSTPLLEHPFPMKAYQKGGFVTAEINAILAQEFYADLLTPTYEVYETEKTRIFDV